jgi:hypothetical protein
LVHVGSIETESKIPPGIKKEEEEEEEEKIVVVVVSYCLSLIRPLGLRTGSIVVVPCDILLASLSLSMTCPGSIIGKSITLLSLFSFPSSLFCDLGVTRRRRRRRCSSV